MWGNGKTGEPVQKIAPGQPAHARKPGHPGVADPSGNRSLWMVSQRVCVVSPLVKWAGGKRQLLASLNSRLPPDWNGFYEPFFGGGHFLSTFITRTGYPLQ